MNCDLWRSHGRIFDQLYSPSGRQIQRNEYRKINNKCSLDLSSLFTVLVGRNFVSGVCKLKTKK